MPNQVSKLVRKAPLSLPGQLAQPAPDQLLDRVRLAQVIDPCVLETLRAPLTPPGGGEGERHVEDAKGDPKGSEDGEEAKLDRDALWAVMTKATCCSKQPPSDAKPSKTLLLFCHLEEQLLDTGQSSPDEAKE